MGINMIVERESTDKEKLLDFIALFNDTNLPKPRLENEAATEIYQEFEDELVILLQELEETVKRL